MCEITGKSKTKTCTGYKVAVKKNGKYYSPSTGAEYAVGKKLKPKKNQYDYGWANPLIHGINFKKEMVENTALFTSKIGAYRFIQESGNTDDLVKLKIKLNTVLYEGEFLHEKIKIGRGITSIEEI